MSSAKRKRPTVDAKSSVDQVEILPNKKSDTTIDQPTDVDGGIAPASGAASYPDAAGGDKDYGQDSDDGDENGVEARLGDSPLYQLIANETVDKKRDVEKHVSSFFVATFAYPGDQEKDDAEASSENQHPKWYLLDDVDVTKLLPGSKLIFKNDDNNISYHGRECTSNSMSLYEYKDYFIEYGYETAGDDLEVMTLTDNCTSLADLFNNMFTVHQKATFDHNALIERIPVQTSPPIVQLFKTLFAANGKAKFLEHMATQYQKHSESAAS